MDLHRSQEYFTYIGTSPTIWEVTEIMIFATACINFEFLIMNYSIHAGTCSLKLQTHCHNIEVKTLSQNDINECSGNFTYHIIIHQIIS